MAVMVSRKDGSQWFLEDGEEGNSAIMEDGSCSEGSENGVSGSYNNSLAPDMDEEECLESSEGLTLRLTVPITTAATVVSTTVTSSYGTSRRGPGRPRGFSVVGEDTPSTNNARDLNRLLIMQPGSRWLRIGRASSKTPPLRFAHCLARRRRETSNLSLENKSFSFSASYSESAIGEVLREAAVLSGHTMIDLLDMREKARAHNSLLKPQGTATKQVKDNKVEVLVIEEALAVATDDRYQLTWPWRHGQLATHGGPGGSLTALTEDLVAVWSAALHRVAADSRRCHVLLLVGDLVPRVQLRLFADVLLSRIGVAGLQLVHEPVAAAFGVGLPAACVLDLGAGKVALSYVEDGVSLSAARLSLAYGGDHVTSLFQHLLTTELAMPQLSWETVEQLKVDGGCHLEPSRLTSASDGGPTVPYGLDWLYVADCGLLAALALFRPTLLSMNATSADALTVIRRYTPPQEAPLPDDVFDELYALFTARERVLESATNTDQGKAAGSGGSSRSKRATAQLDSVPLGLDGAVMEAVERLEPTARQRALNSLVLVGGGAALPGLAEALRRRVAARIGQQQVEVHADFPEASPADVTWRGAQILAENADYLEELWISPKEWAALGSRVLRERCPFVF